MNDGPVNQRNLIETTDCLEAIGVFRSWKNLFFLVLVLCLLVVQAAFWLVDLDIIPSNGTTPALTSVVATPPPLPSAPPSTPPVEPDAAAKSSAQAPAEPNQPAPAVSSALKFSGQLLEKVDARLLARAVEFANGIAIIAMVLYCVALFFSLMVSLVGRLGGIRHISRAFFLAVFMLVLVIPWQVLVGSRMPGVLYSPEELIRWLGPKDDSVLDMSLHYLRFSAYWFIFLVLLVVAQMRSGRWTKSILRRLEII